MILLHDIYVCAFHALLHLAQRPPQSVGLLCILSMLYILENSLTLKQFIYGITTISITWSHTYSQLDVISRFFACLVTMSNKVGFGPVMFAAKFNIEVITLWAHKRLGLREELRKWLFSLKGIQKTNEAYFRSS